MTTPDWWQFVLLALAAWRTWHLVAYDTILDGPRNVVAGLPWTWKDGDVVPRSYRTGFAEFITCPYCSGAWSAVAWWAFSQWSMQWTVWAAVPFALSAAVVVVAQVLDRIGDSR